jgi:hypothetical protein
MSVLPTTPVFSKYVDLKNGSEVGIHKFVVVENGPLWEQTICWDVKRLAQGTVVGKSLNLGNQDTNLDVIVGDGARVTAQADLSGMTNWTSEVRPFEVYLCTFHRGARNSSDRSVA